MTKYSITPLNTGHFPDLSKPVLTYMHGFGEAIRVPIVMWAIEGANQRILVDTGSGNPQRALKYHRFLEQNEAQRPDQALLHIGWKPKDVSMVILTHLHWDHCGNNQLFKQADLPLWGKVKSIFYVIWFGAPKFNILGSLKSFRNGATVDFSLPKIRYFLHLILERNIAKSRISISYLPHWLTLFL